MYHAIFGTYNKTLFAVYLKFKFNASILYFYLLNLTTLLLENLETGGQGEIKN